MKFPYTQKDPAREIIKLGRPVELLPLEKFRCTINVPPSAIQLNKVDVILTDQIHDEITVELGKKYPNLADLMVNVQPMASWPPNAIEIKINYSIKNNIKWYDCGKLDGILSKPKMCDCQMQTLMSSGCQCGGA